MQTNWEKFWTEFPTTCQPQDFLCQVGHTVDGHPYSDAQFSDMVRSVERALELHNGHHLLDVCCGNGVLTSQLASRCVSVTGIDFSPILIDRAKAHHSRPNVSYHVMNAMAIDDLAHMTPPPFDRVLMYAALQHFDQNDLSRLLASIKGLTSRSCIVLIGGVLDDRRKHLFLDTAEKLVRYEQFRREGRDRLGTWWDTEFVRRCACECDFELEIDDFSVDRPGGHYRFDAKLVRND